MLDYAVRNRKFSEDIGASSGVQGEGFNKAAADRLSGYVGNQVRERGLMRQCVSLGKPTESQLVRSVDSELRRVIWDYEVLSPGGLQMPINGLPGSYYWRARKFEIRPAVYSTNRFQKNVRELESYSYDVGQVVADNAVRDLATREDIDFIQMLNDGMVGEESIVPATGSVHWQVISGGITRDSIPQGLAIIPNLGDTTVIDYGLTAVKFIMNTVTIYEFLKWRRDETGGDKAQDVWRNGLTEIRLFSVDGVITIKRFLVPNNVMFFLGPEKYMGVGFQFRDPVMFVHKEQDTMFFQGREEVGYTLANIATVAKARYTS